MKRKSTLGCWRCKASPESKKFNEQINLNTEFFKEDMEYSQANEKTLA